MLSFHFVNDVSNDFRRKVLKPSLPHAIAVETFPKVLQGLRGAVFLFWSENSFRLYRVAVTSRV